ncbi:12096_t:CDS:1, partial [Cetraspora pellucida]
QSNNQYNEYELVSTQDAANTLQDEDVDSNTIEDDEQEEGLT